MATKFPTRTIRQYICGMNLGAKGSVLQELWDFLSLNITCLQVLKLHTL